MNAQREATVGKEPVAPGGDPAVAETRAVSGRRSNLITNPAPVVDPDAPVPEKKVDESTLPASTLAEIEAGRAGLKHTHTAANKPLRPGNPVDATATPQKA
jgi:hypothetical protein